MIEKELAQMGAPPKVVEAGKLCDDLTLSGKPVPRDVQDYVRNWVTNHRGQDRYGK
jgi:hypothetical protein